ncbi:MAG: ribonuclease R family protein [Solirubrobacteraceae bacterium]
MSPEASDSRPAARVAVLRRKGKFLVAEPFFEPGPQIAVSRDRKADVGDLVVVSAGAGGRRGSRRVVISRRLGRPDVARDVIEALMLHRGLRRSFDPAVEHDARDAADAPLEIGTRRDLRDLPTFTIDPASARDFDDAICAEQLDDGSWRVWVHIADVSAYVAPRSSIDREAYRRGTSVYVPGAVEPMLPRRLSNDVCSLVEGFDRLTVTVEMVVSADQRVRSSSMYRSVIRSVQRLDYDRVDRIFAGTERATEPWAAPLAAARAAAGALSRRRDRQTAVVLDSAEPDFSFDREGNVLGSTPVAQTESHRLIEQLMIAANEQVAGFLEQRKIPTLYRVHERPEATSVERLIDQLASLGVPTPPLPKGHLTPQQASDLAGEVSVAVADWVARTGRGGRALSSLVLRTLKQAHYDHRNLGHAGLASPRYCHFTSPIRRYPDLICHRGLLSAVAGDPAPDASWVAAAGPWTSAREREAMTIERDADDIASCFLLERELFEAGDRGAVFEGEVIGLISAGAFVAFGDGLVHEGMLPVRRLRGDWWELNEQATVLVGTRNGGAIRLGDPIAVHVGQIDAPRGRVDLLPATADED